MSNRRLPVPRDLQSYSLVTVVVGRLTGPPDFSGDDPGGGGDFRLHETTSGW